MSASFFVAQNATLWHNLLKGAVMQKVERLNVTLPIDMARMIRAKVEEGRYASHSEIVREAMRAWQEREQLREQRLEAIRAKIDEGDTDPQNFTGDEVRAHLDQLDAELRAQSERDA